MIKEIFDLQNPWRTKLKTEFPPFSREIEPILTKSLRSTKILGLIGSRQVGKSSLLYRLIKNLLNNGVCEGDIFYFNLDDIKLHELFNNIAKFVQFTGKSLPKKYIFIDEIQRLENPGLFLKELHDLNLPFKIIYSGSSQLEIKSKLKENLVGRARIFTIHSLSISEISKFCSPITESDALIHALIYGTYPGVCLEKTELQKRLAIKDIYQTYIEKDIIDFLEIKNTQAFNKLLVLLSGQSGALLNIDNLAKSIRISRNELEHYLNALEGTFVIKRIYPFFKNYKKELTKTPKAYLLDNGIRNFSINNFNSLNLRQDTGELFENVILTEILKKDLYVLNKINFWRTTNQVEIDFIVQNDDGLSAFEVKWKKTTLPRAFKSFKTYYPEAHCKLVNKNNFTELI